MFGAFGGPGLKAVVEMFGGGPLGYLVSIGDVRGFAFTLGLSTLSDLFIVFFFTKPLLQVMGKWKAFDSGKSWTGIGRARAGVVREVAPEYVRRSQKTGV